MNQTFISSFQYELFQGKETVEKKVALNKYRSMIELGCHHFETPNIVTDVGNHHQ